MNKRGYSWHEYIIQEINFVRFVHASLVNITQCILKASQPTSKPRWKQTVGRKNWMSIMDMLAFDFLSPKVAVWIGFLAKRCPCAWFSKWPDLGRTERCRIYNTLPFVQLHRQPEILAEEIIGILMALDQAQERSSGLCQAIVRLRRLCTLAWAWR